MPYGPWLSDWYTSQALSLHSSFMKIYENKKVLILDFSFLFVISFYSLSWFMFYVDKKNLYYENFKPEKWLL